MGDCICGKSNTLLWAVHNGPELADEPYKKEKEILQARQEEAKYFGAGEFLFLFCLVRPPNQDHCVLPPVRYRFRHRHSLPSE